MLFIFITDIYLFVGKSEDINNIIDFLVFYLNNILFFYFSYFNLTYINDCLINNT